jgi:hypothetical protein
MNTNSAANDTSSIAAIAAPGRNPPNVTIHTTAAAIAKNQAAVLVLVARSLELELGTEVIWNLLDPSGRNRSAVRTSDVTETITAEATTDGIRCDCLNALTPT